MEPAQPSNRILIVDDDRDSASSMTALLVALGFKTRTAYSGPEALSCVQQFAPQVVLLDLAMPHMSGIELARQLRADHGGALRIVAITGFLESDYHQAAQQAGADCVLTKPVEPEQLLHAFRAKA